MRKKQAKSQEEQNKKSKKGRTKIKGRKQEEQKRKNKNKRKKIGGKWEELGSKREEQLGTTTRNNKNKREKIGSKWEADNNGGERKSTEVEVEKRGKGKWLRINFGGESENKN